MKSQWIVHKDRKILFADYANFKMDHESLKIEVDYITDILLNEPEKSVLLLVDVRETAGIPEITDCLKNSALKVKNHVSKTAIVGVEGYRRFLLKAVAVFSGMQLTPIDDLEKAKDWLIEDE